MATRTSSTTKAVALKTPKTVTAEPAAQLSGQDHPLVQKARLLEQKSPALLEDMHAVLDRHGFAGSKIRTLSLVQDSGDSPVGSPPDPPLCKRWRCHTDENGDTVCGWVWEPCDS